MAESPGEAEKARLWDLLERIEEEIVSAEVDWRTARDLAAELAERLDAIAVDARNTFGA